MRHHKLDCFTGWAGTPQPPGRFDERHQAVPRRDAAAHPRGRDGAAQRRRRSTVRQVRRALRSQQQPPWLLKANTSTGVLSPNRREVFHYNLPAGPYLLLCYWPDDDTGMPHYLMGMWKLVNLR
jgi:hypothetical protein